MPIYCSKMALKCTREHLNFKIFLGEAPQTPPMRAGHPLSCSPPSARPLAAVTVGRKGQLILNLLVTFSEMLATLGVTKFIGTIVKTGSWVVGCLHNVGLHTITLSLSLSVHVQHWHWQCISSTADCYHQFCVAAIRAPIKTIQWQIKRGAWARWAPPPQRQSTWKVTKSKKKFTWHLKWVDLISANTIWLNCV